MTPRKGIAALVVLGWAVIAWGENPRPTIGIAPVFDGSGAAFGETFAQHLTLFTYQEMLSSTEVRPVLLSPGGVYSPLDVSWLVDYVHDRPDINLLLVATLKPVSNPEKNRWSIPVDLLLLNPSTGESLATWTTNIEIASKKTLVEYGTFEPTPSAIDKSGQALQTIDKYGRSIRSYVIAPSRDFEKQPLGKACAHMANTIKDSLSEKLAGIPPERLGVSAPASLSNGMGAGGGSCPMYVRITYDYKHSASQSYVLLANGLDQSTNLKDGVASFSAPEGDLLLQFSMNDAPYKMETEKFYQMSTWHSCRAANLVLDVGPGGDVHPHWQ